MCGVDEAGRGPLAGPVIAAACILPEGVQVEGVDDSKKFNSEEERELLYEAIMEINGSRHLIGSAMRKG